eukprot:CAMPEP_0175985628 /NCGR_PEP_ID=MMETSP0108-20121206/49681_1 /TAXON_ID=195067 ORGANISM="Goniomonas pacifica, Strain CCMP1869" /NCGR_SAMPLE_ID=MMETSP0108 /ASSEMBLY_ACC=CAM_ASM_000204 /LENGTH=47 /DNA_ID= /DNA_START= /DNA_END= /DNA_ORIENTATION=
MSACLERFTGPTLSSLGRFPSALPAYSGVIDSVSTGAGAGAGAGVVA